MKQKHITTFLAFLLIFILIFIVILQCNPLTTTPTRDGGVFIYVGSLILKGKIPYLDIWENKPPGIYYLNAIGLWLGRGTRWGVWLFEFLFISLSSVVSFFTIKKLWGVWSALLGTVIWLWGLNNTLMGGNFTEEYALLFNFLALMLFVFAIQKPGKWIYPILIGITLVFSFLFKQNNIGPQISIAIVLFVIYAKNKLFKRFFQLMATWGGIIVLVLGGVCLFFWMHNSLTEFTNAAFIYNLYYSGNHFNPSAMAIQGFKFLGFPAWLGFSGFFAALIGLFSQIKNKSDPSLNLLMVVGFPIEILSCSLSGRFYQHYFMSWLPIIAILSGYLFHQVSPYLSKIFYLVFSKHVNDFIREKSQVLLTCVIILTVFFFRVEIGLTAKSFHRLLFNRSLGIQRIQPVARYIRKSTEPDDPVLVWGGQAGINWMSQRLSPTKYHWYPLIIDSPLEQEMVIGFMDDLKNNPPELIVDAYVDDPYNVLSLNDDIRNTQIMQGHGKASLNPINFNQVVKWIHDNYFLETMVDSYGVYRIKVND